ncbi:MAG: FecR domain-containing protein [Bacteroidetes bacterium]|nr:FecR domain-containing protein [Bacteroidota bacterium]
MPYPRIVFSCVYNSIIVLQMNEEEAKRQIRAALEEAAQSNEDMDEARASHILSSIYRLDNRRRFRLRAIKGTAAAAILLSIIWGTTHFLKQNQPIPTIAQKHQDTKQDIPPGTNKAILKLASGKLIDLDDARAGAITGANAEIVKGTSGAKLCYAPGQEPEINMVSTPRGGQYQIRLADGSTVWLNASSSLRFPTAFTGPDRTVELTGEAYFDIAKKSNIPFLVKINNTTVEVLGTEFNINGYDDEPSLKTTLVTGAVRVETAGKTLLLKPGQQTASQAEGLHLTPNPDLEESLAWKNGTFNFNKLDITTIMRQISRWYDVDIVYEGPKPSGHFSGIISRNTPVSTVLKMLEYGGVHCKVAGKKIVIMPN